MSLIQCPECQKQVSSSANSCPNCGYPLSTYVKELEIRRLTEKILPCEFTVPEPRAKVCIKCAKPFQYVNPELNDFKKPICSCGMPGVEVDYTQVGLVGWGAQFYVLKCCCEPRNIGDTNSQEYQSHVAGFERYEKKFNTSLTPTPPDLKNFGVTPEEEWYSHSFNQPAKPDPHLPRCPYCSSTDLTKITVAKKAGKTFLFGLLGALDDAGKTYKCNNCVGKF